MDEDSLESTNYYRERPPQLPRKRKTGTTSQSTNAGESLSNQIICYSCSLLYFKAKQTEP